MNYTTIKEMGCYMKKKLYLTSIFITVVIIIISIIIWKKDNNYSKKNIEQKHKEKIAKIMGIEGMDFEVVEAEFNKDDEKYIITGRLSFDETDKEEFVNNINDLRYLADKYCCLVCNYYCPEMFERDLTGINIEPKNTRIIDFNRESLEKSIKKVKDKKIKNKLIEINKQIEVGNSTQLYVCYWTEEEKMFVQFKFYDETL